MEFVRFEHIKYGNLSIRYYSVSRVSSCKCKILTFEDTRRSKVERNSYIANAL